MRLAVNGVEGESQYGTVETASQPLLSETAKSRIT
jgi:hypothetical protein